MGGYPILNYLVLLAVFLTISFIMNFYIEDYGLTYLFTALFAVGTRSSSKYIDFLKLTYSKSDYFKIRFTENTVSALPFALFMCFTGGALMALILLVLSTLLVFARFKVKWQIAIPTPFYKYPFEFIVGFRVTFFIFLFAYYLTYISIHYANFGIGLFAILAVSVFCTMFYFKVEDFFYVWIFSSNAKGFLFDKMKIAVFYDFVLTLPILIALTISHPSSILVILAFQAIGLCYVCVSVLSKYSAFPGEIGVREGLLVLFSIIFPPLLFFLVPYLYKRSIRSLEGILV